MKPITNLLLIVSLICYVFLPFMDMGLTGTVTGLTYTSGMITENFSLGRTVFALLPFIVCFVGVTLNSMKNRYWGLASGLVILVGIYFYLSVDTNFKFPLTDPDLTTDSDMEGIRPVALVTGYTVSYILMWAALISCIVSLMPFKFNTILERSIDEHIEKGIHRSKEEITKVGHEIHEEFEHLESKAKIKKAHPAEPKKEVAPAEEAPKPKVENPEDYMPKEARTEATSTEEKPSEPSDDEKWSDYMPK